MANANVLELTSCVEQCIEYCESNPDEEFAQYFLPRLKQARTKWKKSAATADREYRDWQDEAIEDKLAWKHVARELKSVQKMLRNVNAIGHPKRRVLHWDTEELEAAVLEMVSYLRDHADDIEEAASAADKLERMLASAKGESSEEDEALDEYNRHVLFLAEALGTLNNTIAEFRESMRNNVGKQAEDYQSIRWPMSVAPDETVL